MDNDRSDIELRRTARLRLIHNPNYFGNLTNLGVDDFPAPTLLKVDDTNYEELTCLGYNPDTEILTAVVRVKLGEGYYGGPCTDGSREYVRFSRLRRRHLGRPRVGQLQCPRSRVTRPALLCGLGQCPAKAEQLLRRRTGTSARPGDSVLELRPATEPAGLGTDLGQPPRAQHTDRSPQPMALPVPGQDRYCRDKEHQSLLAREAPADDRRSWTAGEADSATGRADRSKRSRLCGGDRSQGLSSDARDGSRPQAADHPGHPEVLEPTRRRSLEDRRHLLPTRLRHNVRGAPLRRPGSRPLPAARNRRDQAFERLFGWSLHARLARVRRLLPRLRRGLGISRHDLGRRA